MKNKCDNFLRAAMCRIIKRDDIVWWKAWIIRIVAVLLALVVCGVVTVLLTGLNPIDVYITMIKGAVGTSRLVWNLLQNTAILLCVSLAVTPAFKMKFWNIGAEGQTLIGGLAAAACMIYFGEKLPAYLILPLTAFASIAAGLIWGVIPAYFKSKFDTNETLFTLMMNYVAMQLVSYFVILWENPKNSSNVGIINMNSHGGWLPVLFDQKYLLNIIVVTLLTVLVYIYLKYSKQGYEISVVGESQNTARYIGINVKKVIIRTMAISGALCGIAGFLLVAGTDHTINTAIVGGMGFTAIMVSWLAKFNPGFMVLTSFLIVFLDRGAGEIATAFQLNESIADIITGIILFFIIGSEFFVQYKLTFRKKHKEETK